MPDQIVETPVDTDKPADIDFKAELDKIRSWNGRLEATNKQLSEQVGEILQAVKSQPKKNEDLNSEFFDNPEAAVQKILELREESKRNLSAMKERQLDQAMESMAEAPFFKELKENVKDAAKQLLGKFDPEAAARIAYSEVTKQAMQNMIKGYSPSDFEMLSSGQAPKPKQVDDKLPPIFEDQYQKGLNEGLWENRKEFKENVSPAIRKKHGF